MKFIVTKNNEQHIKERLVEELVAQGKVPNKQAGMKLPLNISAIAQSLSKETVHQETDRYYILVEGQGMFAVKPTADKYTWIVKTFFGLSRLKDGNAGRAYKQITSRKK